MTPEYVVDIGRQAIETALTVSAPLLLVALGIGLTISVLQAATQINEQTMTFIPKIVGVFVALLIAAPWMIQKLVTFASTILRSIATVGG